MTEFQFNVIVDGIPPEVFDGMNVHCGAKSIKAMYDLIARISASDYAPRELWEHCSSLVRWWATSQRRRAEFLAGWVM